MKVIIELECDDYGEEGRLKDFLNIDSYKSAIWDFDIWLGAKAQARHVAEYFRVINDEGWEASWSETQVALHLQLKVRNPIQGLYYVIKWRPS